jgi:putative flippase GtrA
MNLDQILLFAVTGLVGWIVLFAIITLVTTPGKL